LFEPRDEKSLYAALDRLLADKHLCKKLGNSAREKAEKELGFKYKYSLEDGLKKLIAWREEKGIRG
jgi:nucleoside-diphosphate-sugar epimerase